MPGRDAQRVHDVVQLHKEGISRRAIARALRNSRNTVRQILADHARGRVAVHSALPPPRGEARASKLDTFWPQIDELFLRYPDITGQRVFEILREKGFEGGRTIVTDLVRRIRPKPPPKPSLETPPREPGDMAECDWSPYPVVFTHAPRMALQAFGYTLRFSTRKYYRFFEGNGLHPLMDGHVHAFERLGGAARRCTYDSQKPVVLRWEGNQPILNPRFIDFATHYEFEVVAVRHAPNRKPREAPAALGGVPRAQSPCSARGLRHRRLLKALSHAVSCGALEHTAVENILQVQARRRRLDEYVAEASTKKLSTVIAQSCTEPRDLAEYDALPVRGSLPVAVPGEAPCPSPSETAGAPKALSRK